MSEWFQTLDGLLNKSWQVMAKDAGDFTVPVKRTVLATIGLNGGPEARIVVLRAADRDAGSVAVHTDTISVKVGELRANPRAALHIWEEALDLQIRLRGQAEIASGPAVAELWNRVPDGSRSSYGVQPAPGTPIAASDAYTRVPNPDQFAVLTLKIAEMDIVHLSADFHRRALFQCGDGWAGQWLAP